MYARLPLLMILFASCATTGGVERAFVAQLQASGNMLQSLADAQLDDRSVLQTLANCDVASIFVGAMQVWAEVYGEARLSGANRAVRLDAGAPKPPKPGSEKAWIDRRRLAARVAALPGGAGTVVQPTETWTPAHDGEVAFPGQKSESETSRNQF